MDMACSDACGNRQAITLHYVHVGDTRCICFVIIRWSRISHDQSFVSFWKIPAGEKPCSILAEPD
ncbi:hypothetical protein CS542_02215 [Pedobacter sp. IW39]|nr:hypothetical protein CS542_02215 [Pedobacter sp. IW39]